MTTTKDKPVELTAAITSGPIKEGYKTTEFWLASAGSLAALLGVLGGVLPGSWGVFAMAISSGLYSISRGMAKM